MSLIDDSGELRWQEIHEAMQDFQSYLAPEVERLQIQTEQDVPDWSKRRGVYLLFDEHEQLLYVGYTLVRFQSRVPYHIRRIGPRWIDLIILADEIAFLAPALEFFLRDRLRPLIDDGGKHV